jgi:endoglucanase
MDNNNISWINWNLSNKAESSSALTAEPTPEQGTSCSPSTLITLDFTQNGSGEYCWETDSIGGYINSWNLDVLEVNGVDFANTYAGSAQLPAKIDGHYYIYYKCSVSWGHFEAHD